MSGSRRTVPFAGVLVALLAVSAAFLSPASAARLLVSAAPIQTWKITDLPEPPEPTVDLSVCGDLDGYDQVIYGTDGDDRLVAKNGRQIIVGLAGDDLISSGNHDDCLIGGAGDDRLLGGNGRDRLFGQEGADWLDGGTGKDLMDAGGDPGDSCTSVGAPDVLVGCGTPALADEAPAQNTSDVTDQDSEETPEPGHEPSDDPNDESNDEPNDEPTSGPVDEPSGQAGDEPSEPAGDPGVQPSDPVSEMTTSPDGSPTSGA